MGHRQTPGGDSPARLEDAAGAELQNHPPAEVVHVFGGEGVRFGDEGDALRDAIGELAEEDAAIHLRVGRVSGRDGGWGMGCVGGG